MADFGRFLTKYLIILILHSVHLHREYFGAIVFPALQLTFWAIIHTMLILGYFNFYTFGMNKTIILHFISFNFNFLMRIHRKIWARVLIFCPWTASMLPIKCYDITSFGGRHHLWRDWSRPYRMCHYVSKVARLNLKWPLDWTYWWLLVCPI